MKLINFNINDYILVQITEYGWEYLQKSLFDPEGYIKHVILAREVKINGEIWYRLQMFHVMELFGQHFNGNPSPIRLRIKFEKKTTLDILFNWLKFQIIKISLYWKIKKYLPNIFHFKTLY